MKMTTDKARFETENGVRVKQTKIYTSTIAKGVQLDSEDEDDEDDQFPIQMNAEIETIQKQVRNKVSEDKVQMRKQLGGALVDFGENCWRKIPTATKKGLHVIGKMPGMIFCCENRLETYFQSRQMSGTTLLGKRQKFCAVVIRKINASWTPLDIV